MATRTRKKSKPKARHFRCSRCRSPIPVGYNSCGSCGFNASEDLFERALTMFPGSREVTTA